MPTAISVGYFSILHYKIDEFCNFITKIVAITKSREALNGLKLYPLGTIASAKGKQHGGLPKLHFLVHFLVKFLKISRGLYHPFIVIICHGVMFM